IDLATGGSVLLLVSSAGGRSEQLRWTARCDLLSRLAHPALARLVDYGPVGETRRFEAWNGTADWCGSRVQSVEVFNRAQSFFAALGLTRPRVSSAAIATDSGRAVVVPDDGAGYEVSGDEQVVCRELGVLHVPRPELQPLFELLEQQNVNRPTAIALVG